MCVRVEVQYPYGMLMFQYCLGVLGTRSLWSFWSLLVSFALVLSAPHLSTVAGPASKSINSE